MQQLDEHSLEELQIFSANAGEPSILQFFDKTVSYGGRDVLKKLLQEPPENLQSLLQTQACVRHMADHQVLWQMEISHAYVDAAERYFKSNIAHTASQDVFQHWFQTFIFSFRNPTEYQYLQSGLQALLRLLRAMASVLEHVKTSGCPELLKDEFDILQRFFETLTVRTYLYTHRLSRTSVFYLDYFFRNQQREETAKVFEIYYRLDAYGAVAATMLDEHLVLPEFVENLRFEVDDLRHPLISNPITNNFVLAADIPVCMLTGANTSGKTTFLKTCGLSVYLAHLGWPVPATSMQLSYFNRLFTSIHLSDDIRLGYSHFYNEIMRVKAIANGIHQQQRCFVIIDELFRGTNQDDANYCSQVVLDGFARSSGSFFLISTHLLELIERNEQKPGLCFYCFRTSISGNDFHNTFKLEAGVAAEKVGKLILHQTGIVDLLKKPLPVNPTTFVAPPGRAVCSGDDQGDPG